MAAAQQTTKPKKMKIITPVFRGSFANLVTPRAIEEGGELKFSIMAVLPKADPETKRCMARIEAAVTECLKLDHGKDILPHSSLKHWPIADGDTMGEGYEAQKGSWCFRASGKFKPQCIDMAQQVLTRADELYSGAWYRISFDVYYWTGKYGTGVSFGLLNVLKVRDDEQFTSRGKAEDDFSEFLDGNHGDSQASAPADDLGLGDL